MPGLVPGIPLGMAWPCHTKRDGRDKPGHDKMRVSNLPGQGMFERALNAFWILLGAASAAYSWTLGLIGPSGPESGLFPLIAGLIVMGSGVMLMLAPAHAATAFSFPRGEPLYRIIGVVLGLAWLALALPYLGFELAGIVTMLVLLRAVERVSWAVSFVLAVVSVVAVSWLFGHLLGMPLPRGPWGF